MEDFDATGKASEKSLNEIEILKARPLGWFYFEVNPAVGVHIRVKVHVIFS